MAELHGHGQHRADQLSNARLLTAIALNLLLTVAEVAGGIVAGSLALVADALHNLNDCASLLIALIARRVSQRRADEFRTFGYRRAEVVGALINLTTLVLVSLYLVAEAVWRLFAPEEIQGWIVLVIATVALAADLATAVLLYAMAKGSINVRAAFLHNLSDALASLGVIFVAVAVLLWKFHLADLLITFLIAGYILWQSTRAMSTCIAILMEGVPKDVDLDKLVAEIRAIKGVLDCHHLHVWQLDEHQRAMEAHVVIASHDCQEMAQIGAVIKQRMADLFAIHHSTLEFEFPLPPGQANTHDRSVIPEH